MSESSGGWSATRARMRTAYAELGARQKSTKGAPAYTRYVNRRAGRGLAAMSYAGGLTANFVSVLSAVLSFSAIALLAVVPPTPASGVSVAVLLSAGYAFDSADGQVARLRGPTVAGEWLDHVIDAAKIPSLHLAVLVGMYRFSDVPPWQMFVPIVFCLVASVHFSAALLNDLLLRVYGSRFGASHERSPRLRPWLALPTDYGVVCWSFVFWGCQPLFGVLYSLLLAAKTAFLAAALVVWYRSATKLRPHA